MSKKFTWRFLFLLAVLLLSSLACEFTRQFTEWYRSDIEEDDVDRLMCTDNLALLRGSKITCDESTSPKVTSFAGKVLNNSDYYAHGVSFEVRFNIFPEEYCTFNFDEIAPGATVEALCQIKASHCAKSIHSIDEISCKLMTYPEHLDWLTAKDEKTSQEPDSDENSSNEEDSFALTQTHIDMLHDTYRQSFEDNPCEPDIAKQAFLAWLQAQANTWSDEAGKVIGEGKQFPNLEVFMEWLTLQAKVGEIFPITKGWSSDFELSITPLVSCFACTPPKLTGTLDLTVDLKTCQVTGKISAEGEGDVTINDCVDNKPIDDTCTSHGKVNISGDITGTATKDGQLTLNPTKAKFTYATQWIDGCEWDPQEVQNSSWEDPITITGSLEWKGSAAGKIHWASTFCSMNGDWTGDQK